MTEFKHSIYLKLLIPMLALMIILVSTLSGFHLLSQRNMLTHELKVRNKLFRNTITQRGQKIAENLYRHTQSAIKTNDMTYLMAHIYKTVIEDRDLYYVLLTDETDFSYISTSKKGIPEAIFTEKRSQYALRQTESVSFEYEHNTIPYMERIYPVYKGREKWGVLRFGFSLEEIKKRKQDTAEEIRRVISSTIWLSVIIGILYLLAGCGVIYLLTRKLIRPITTLALISTELSRNNFEAVDYLKFKSNDEIGVLSHAFRKMAKNLKATMESLKTSKKQLEKQNETLEETVEERVQELKSANKDLINFAYIVSHDLKAPLRAIGSLTSWIQSDYQDKFDEEGNKNLNMIMNRVERMHNLIEGILAYSRVGQAETVQESVKLNALIEEIKSMLEIPEYFTFTVDSLPTVAYDPTQIYQVFQNLISNAIKYNDKTRDAQIVIGCKEHPQEWELYVRDNGPGIDKEHHQKIFQIFQTLQARDDYESTGIGLTITKKIIELNGGQIWVKSELENGTTFFFTIPKRTKKQTEIGVEIGETIPS